MTKTIQQSSNYLIELLRMRDDVLSNPDLAPEEQREQVAALETAIRESLQHAADQVGVAKRYYDTLAAGARAEMEYQKKRAEAIGEMLEWLEQQTIEVMMLLGVKRIEGPTATLRIVRNPASVEVGRPDLVPPEYQRFEMTMSLALSMKLAAHLRCTDEGAMLLQEIADTTKRTATEPMKSKISEEMRAQRDHNREQLAEIHFAKPYAKCNDAQKQTIAAKLVEMGVPSFPGCVLIEDKVRLDIK